MTKIVFILGSGRCGTYQIAEILRKEEMIGAYHEYMFEMMLKPAVMYRMGMNTQKKSRNC